MELHHHSGCNPQLINALCSRVLLFSVDEEAGEIMIEMVTLIAGELDRNLGSRIAASQPRGIAAVGDNNLVHPIEAFEISVTRQERVFCSILVHRGQPDGARS